MPTLEPVEAGRRTVEELREAIEQAITRIPIKSEPVLLYDPARYILSSGGKRLRPILFLLTANAFGTSRDEVMPGALAIEVFHNFTLVHDDIMDHADTRRGRETVHRKWDESTAILSGDYLMALAYELVSKLPVTHLPAVLNSFHRMVRELCEGQALDKDFEARKNVTVDAYLDMIDRKTGALIQAVFELGGIIGGAKKEDLDRLRQLGKNVGRAFQIQDDLLDLTASTPKWGKKIGGDLIEGKKTYLLLQALERTNGTASAFFKDIVDRRGLDEAEVPTARYYMEEAGVLQLTREAVFEYTERALDGLAVLPVGSASNTIKWLIQNMQQRLH